MKSREAKSRQTFRLGLFCNLGMIKCVDNTTKREWSRAVESTVVVRSKKDAFYIRSHAAWVRRSTVTELYIVVDHHQS